MEVRVFADADELAREAAQFVALAARESVDTHGRFLMALSGGSTPAAMLEALAKMDLPWAHTHVFQVDERVTPDATQRNITMLRHYLLDTASLPETQLHPMAVEEENLEAAARGYANVLETTAGAPPVLDLVHLGLGADGHTASLTPGDPALDVADRPVAFTGRYHGCHRMTLTYPVLNRARRVLWLVSGAAKRPALERLEDGDERLPAGRVARVHAVVFADRAARAPCGGVSKRRAPGAS